MVTAATSAEVARKQSERSAAARGRIVAFTASRETYGLLCSARCIGNSVSVEMSPAPPTSAYVGKVPFLTPAMQPPR